MTELLCVLVGLAVGGPAAWLLCAARMRALAQQELSALQQQAGAAQSVVTELRGQVAREQADLSALRKSLDDERQARVRSQTQCDAAIESAAQQRSLLEEAKVRLSEAFQALSGDALARNNQSFLSLAGEAFHKILAEARGDLSKRQEAIDGLIRPLKESLTRYEQHVQTIEQSRLSAYASLCEQVKSLASTGQQLQKETGNLVTALRAPQVRGRWGELTLHRVVELAGMSEHCDYAEQVSVESDNGKLRPDMVVHLPSNRDIVVDSKVSLEAYLRAVSSASQEERAACLDQHAQQIRTHMQRLSAKSYWEQFAQAPEFVVMFIPGESFFAAALDCDPALLEDGMKQRVVLATPTTLISLLQAVAYGWRQEQMAQNAKAALDLVKDFYDRVKTLASYVVELGASIKKANTSYNKVVGSMETRLLPAARRLKEMGLGGDDLEVIEPLDVTPRHLTAEEPIDPPMAEA